jgi:hypothetical protein
MLRLPALLLLHVACALAVQSPLLLVVGDVNTARARVLVEWVAPGAPQRLSVWLQEGFSSLQHLSKLPSSPPTAAFLPSDAPSVLILDGLVADKNYTAVFGSLELGVVDAATFSTHALTPERILAFSCDRYLEDNDDEFVSLMADVESQRYSLAIHMGDQVKSSVLFVV